MGRTAGIKTSIRLRVVWTITNVQDFRDMVMLGRHLSARDAAVALHQGFYEDGMEITVNQGTLQGRWMVEGKKLHRRACAGAPEAWVTANCDGKVTLTTKAPKVKPVQLKLSFSELRETSQNP